MNKDDDLNSEKMVEKCCSCVGWGLRSGTKKRWARATLTPTTCFRGFITRPYIRTTRQRVLGTARVSLNLLHLPQPELEPVEGIDCAIDGLELRENRGLFWKE